MKRTRRNKLIVAFGLLALAFALCFAGGKQSAAAKNDGEIFCGLPVVEESYIRENYPDSTAFSDTRLYFMGEPAPYMADTKTYLVTEDPLSEDFSSTLTYDDDITVFAVKDDHFARKADAIAGNYSFTVYFCREGQAEKRQILFTTLPVMVLSQESKVKNEEQAVGQMTLFSVDDSSGAYGYEVKTSAAEWHVRGNTTDRLEKKGYRISLLTDSGEKNNVNLLGFGKDDDWVLDAMALDGTKMREQFANAFLAKEEAGEKDIFSYPRCAYVEVLQSDSYYGLFTFRSVLARKNSNFDKSKDFIFEEHSYLETVENQWLYALDEGVSCGCVTLKYSPPGKAGEVWEKIRAFCQLFVFDEPEFDPVTALEMVSLDNQIFHCLLVNCFEMRDNWFSNNVCYFYDASEGTYYRTMWDFDGILWGKPDYIVESEEILRWEKADPQIRPLLCKKWAELREDVFTMEHFESILNPLQHTLAESGCLQREQQRWPNYRFTENAEQELLKTLEYRLALLDGYYQ